MGVRNCFVRGSFGERFGDEHITWRKDWFILECCGCNNVFIQTVSSNSEDVAYDNDENGEPYEYPVETKTYWPAISKRKKPDWLTPFGILIHGCNDLDTILVEVYDALDRDIKTLAAMGMRTAFDISAKIVGIDDNQPFEKKLDELVSRKLIRPAERDRLSTLVDAGNASVHRGWVPSADGYRYYCGDTRAIHRRCVYSAKTTKRTG